MKKKKSDKIYFDVRVLGATLIVLLGLLAITISFFPSVDEFSDDSLEVYFSPDFKFKSITSGSSHTCAILQNDATMCWGFNTQGQLGNGKNINSYLPVSVSGNYLFKSISSGSSHTCGLLNDGTALCWGVNGQSQLGTGNTQNSNIPIVVSGNHKFTSISAGVSHTCGLLNDGTALCWGSNGRGQLGTGNKTQLSRPSNVIGNYKFIMITSGDQYTCGLLNDGTALCWGRNDYGQLGTGNESDSTQPLLVSGNHKFTSISAGSGHTCGLLNDGTALCWGAGTNGQLGTGNTQNSNIPIVVSGNHKFKEIGAGYLSTCGLLDDGTALCWGRNSEGQLGNGETIRSNVPVPVLGNYNFSTLAYYWYHKCGLLNDGTALCWGRNNYGELGTDSIFGSTVPLKVVQKSYYLNLPSGFTPVTGYTFSAFDSTGNQFLNLWDLNGRLLVYNHWQGNWTDFTAGKTGVQGRLPTEFKPIVGFYSELNGKIVLINSSRVAYTNHGVNTWVDETSSVLPASYTGSTPVIGFYHSFGGGRNVIWDNLGQVYIYNPSDNMWYNRTSEIKSGLGGRLPVNFNPIVGFYNNNTNKIYLFDASKTLFTYQPETYVDETANLRGLPSATLTAGYYDQILGKSILWFGSDVYGSIDGVSFTKIELSSLPLPPEPNPDPEPNLEIFCNKNDTSYSGIRFYTLGNLTYSTDGITNVSVLDYCINSTHLLEGGCSLGSPTNTTYFCRQGCLVGQGKCNGTMVETCVQPSTTRNVTVKSYVNYTLDGVLETRWDICLSNRSQVGKYYCENNYSRYIVMNCPLNSTCYDGACRFNMTTNLSGNVSQEFYCSTDANCQQNPIFGSNYYCHGNQCRLKPTLPTQPGQTSTRCDFDSDCTSDQVCSKGYCVDKTNNLFLWVIVITLLILIAVVIATIIFVLIKRDNKNRNQFISQNNSYRDDYSRENLNASEKQASRDLLPLVDSNNNFKEKSVEKKEIIKKASGNSIKTKKAVAKTYKPRKKPVNNKVQGKGEGISTTVRVENIQKTVEINKQTKPDNNLNFKKDNFN